jgi:uncharacterized membrane protein YphA (DoxX/SURF4 family)
LRAGAQVRIVGRNLAIATFPAEGRMPEQLYPWIHLVGRIFFSIMFIGSGLKYLMKLDDTAGYVQSRGVPAAKAVTVIIGLVFVVGGVLVLLGWSRFIGAGLLAIITFLTAVVLHRFWTETDPAAKANEMAHSLKDLALCGAALLIAYYAGTSWPMSLGG